MSTNFEQMMENLAAMSPEERERFGRIVRGEDKDDSIRRGDVYEVIRDLRTTPAVGSRDYQKALGNALVAVSRLDRQDTPA